jgi:hypothetical protein
MCRRSTNTSQETPLVQPLTVQIRTTPTLNFTTSWRKEMTHADDGIFITDEKPNNQETAKSNEPVRAGHAPDCACERCMKHYANLPRQKEQTLPDQRQRRGRITVRW